VPPTERNGRVHSSTVTVAVLKSNTQKRREFADKDFRVEWFSGTGGGGQYRNKHQNSCRLIHIETGLVESAQCRSRANSYKEAKEALIRRIEAMDANTHHQHTASIRKNQVGSGMRGDKIRTYRFRDDIVTDHESGKSASCTKVMKGNFDLLWKN
jgi:peptide chain release factor 1